MKKWTIGGLLDLLDAAHRQPLVDLAWYVRRRLERRTSPVLPSGGPGLSAEGDGAGEDRSALIPPVYAEPPQVSEVMEGAFRVFGAGPFDFRRTDEDAADDRSNGTTALRLRWLWDPISEREWKDAARWSAGPSPDIKVPWELGRCHALPQIAVAHGCGRWDDGRLAKAAEDLVADFLDTNPVGQGVHWLSALEIAVRAINWIVAFELLKAKRIRLAGTGGRLYEAALVAHGVELERCLSWVPRGRNNHYLCEVVGLAALGAALPPSTRADRWLAFGYQELTAEAESQFLPDGGSFEGSTAYHGFGLEILLWGALLCLASASSGRRLDPDLAGYRPPAAPRLRREPLERWGVAVSEGALLFPETFLQRLDRAADFLEDVHSFEGEAVQIGDNDSGRLIKLGIGLDDQGEERLLDYRGIVSAIRVITGRPWEGRKLVKEAMDVLLQNRDSPGNVERSASPILIDKARSHHDGVWTCEYHVWGDTCIDRGLEVVEYPCFGVVIWRTPSLFLLLRCPKEEWRHPRGGHLHADELSLQLALSRIWVIRDPGTGCYTGDPSLRNRMRNRSVHFTPLPDIGRMPRGRVGLFTAPRLTDVTLVWRSRRNVIARACEGGNRYSREIVIEDTRVLVRDTATRRIELLDPDEWRESYSPRYGLTHRFRRGT